PYTVGLANPTINTIDGGTVMVGTGAKLTDSAQLAAGFSPTGTITFYLMPPGSTASTSLSSAVYTDVLTGIGNDTSTTSQGNNPGGFLPTVAGTYNWVAVYSGDSHNAAVSSPFGDEPETASGAQADLAITKTDGTTTYTPGGTTTYTIVVSNNGPSAVT